MFHFRCLNESNFLLWSDLSLLIITVSFISSGQKSRKGQSSGKRLGCLLSALFYFYFPRLLRQLTLLASSYSKFTQ